MAAISCPSCGKTLNVSEQYAGKKVRCPNCQGILTVPALAAPATPLASEEVMPVAPAPRAPRPAAPPLPPGREAPPYVAPPPGRRPPAYDDDRPRGRPVRDDDYDVRRMRRPGTQYAPCPSCGNDDATRLNWTFWGGWLGPAIINVVRCHRCGTNYNGVHGDYNGGRIAIYVVISIVISLVVGGIIIAASIANS